MKTSILALSLASAAAAQQTAWGQCGGVNWTGATTCVSGYYCKFNSEYYSQCIPGVASAVSSTSSTKPATSGLSTSTKSSTSAISSSASTTTKSSAASSTVTGGTSATGGPGTTLQSGYYWIRAVEAPNFHAYLQTNPVYKPGVAIMDSYTTAGQFQVVAGQLVELIDSTHFLYGNVIANTTAATKLALEFRETKNEFGTFSWSGDALQWSAANVTRQNLSAWLVCEKQSLWINLGAYLYMTPAGCADETIHYYNDKTAVA